MTLALEARALKDDVIVSDTPKGRSRAARQKSITTAGRLWKHAALADLDGLIAPADLEALFILTLVRNPWDRVVSYYHWLRAQRFGHPAVKLAQAHDFSAFLNHPQTVQSLQHWPYGAYVRDTEGRERARLMARVEALAEDLEPFEAHLGFRLTPIARANESDRARDWRGFYSDRDAALIAGLCAKDIARFGYRFDP